MNESDMPAFDFTRDEYELWYHRSKFSLFEPALRTVERLIDQWLTMELSDADREKFRISATRVKGMNSLWSKIQKPKYASRILTLGDIPEAVDDIVGLRVTCNNNCDLELLRNMMADLPSDPETENWITLQSDSEKLYFQSPKSSGYRAYHVNVRTLIHTPGDWEPVTAEIQARTLLQDGWGELTHEDTYKPGVQLPTLATTLARRMADLLATVDDIAQDLRDELDRLAEASATSPDESQMPMGPTLPAVEPTLTTTGTESATDEALISEARNVASRLSKPASLASIAQSIQASFDRGAAKNWGTFGSLGSLLEAAVPEFQIIYDPPGYLIPPGTSIVEDEENDAPAVVRRLRWRDKFAPAVASEQLGCMIESIAEALQQDAAHLRDIQDGPVDARFHNAVVKAARDSCERKGMSVSRSRLNYLSNSLRMTGALRLGMSTEEIAEALTASIFARAEYLAIVRDRDAEYKEIEDWLDSALEAISPAKKTATQIPPG